MTVGTRSVLFGVHCWFLHPWFVAWGWKRLYGFPWDPRLWVAFFIHDLGYWGKPNMDGPEGETHVELGAQWMGRLFGKKWGDFCRYHSRFYAKQHQRPLSPLAVADKLAFVLTPMWIYLPMARWSGEIEEYQRLADSRHAAGEPRFEGKYSRSGVWDLDQVRWHANVREYLRRWVEEHRDGRHDTWTPDTLQG